jgi:hypothetical protein
MFLRFLIKYRINKVYENESYFLTQHDFFKKYNIYHYKINIMNNNIFYFNNQIYKNIKLNFCNNEIIKLFFLLEKNINIYKYFKYSFINIGNIMYLYLF